MSDIVKEVTELREERDALKNLLSDMRNAFERVSAERVMAQQEVAQKDEFAKKMMLERDIAKEKLTALTAQVSAAMVQANGLIEVLSESVAESQRTHAPHGAVAQPLRGKGSDDGKPSPTFLHRPLDAQMTQERRDLEDAKSRDVVKAAIDSVRAVVR